MVKMWSVVRSYIQTVFAVNRGSACVIPRLRRIRRKGVVGKRSDLRRRAERAVHHPASFLYNWYALPVMVRRPCIYGIFILRRIAFIRNAFARLMLYMIAFARIIGQSTNVYGRNSFLFVPFSPCSTSHSRKLGRCTIYGSSSQTWISTVVAYAEHGWEVFRLCVVTHKSFKC